MKFKTASLLVIFFIAIVADIYAQPAIDFVKNENANFFRVREKYKEYLENNGIQDESIWKKFKRWEYFWETRILPDGSYPSAVNILKELSEFKKITPETQVDKHWTNIGPQKNPNTSQGGVGRVNVIRVKPDNENVIWLGAASGGVWHTNNGGLTWDVFDFTGALSIGISDIAFCASHPNVAYVATGDADGIGATYSTYSSGVIKTTDNGLTWDFTNIKFELSNGKIVAALAVHDNNPDIVLAATSLGIYKTTDGGKTWRLKTVTNGYFRALTQNIDNPDLVLATTYSNLGKAEIYRSTDFGNTWKSVQTLNGVRRAAIDFAESDADYVYVLGTSGSYFHSFWRSVDGGKTWKKTASIQNTPNILGRDKGTGGDRTVGQGWYDLAIAVSPGNEDEVFTGGINIWHTTDGGNTFSMVTHWTGRYHKPYVHADIHSLTFDLNTGKLYSGSDGGIDYSSSPEHDWINLNKGLAITQYYKIAVASDQPDFIYGGSQDNGTHQYNAGSWTRVYGGDGMDCVIDYNNYKRAIISMYYGSFFKTINGHSFYQVLSSSETHEQGAWVTPIMINPVNSKSFYAGYKNVWKSLNAGTDWHRISNLHIGTLLNMAISKKDTNVIYVSSSSTLSKSTDGGTTFKTISGTPSPIKGITVDANDPDRIWIAVGGFNKTNKVLMYDGANWVNVSGNTPNVPVNCIIYQENSPDRLYIGTDLGVMFTDYNSGYWEFYGSGMPNIIISDLEINYKRNKLYASSYGRGVWTTELNTCNVEQPGIIVDGKTTICEGNSVKLTADTDDDNIVWSTGEKTKSIFVDKPGIYSYSLPNINGCLVRSQSVNITVFKIPNLKIKPVGNFPICTGDEIDLSLSASFGFKSYLWSTGETSRKIAIDKPGDYSVVATTKDGCEISAKFKVEVYEKPQKPVVTRWSDTELISSPADAYQWYLDDNKLQNDTNRIFVIKQLGTYKVKIFNDFGCSNMSDPMDVVTDITVQNENGINIFPNPTTGKLTVDMSGSGFKIAHITITDLIGKNIYNKKIDGTTKLLNIDLSKHKAGIYIIEIFSNKRTLISRIIKR
jgi:photosystem II stability/assembly factor-like uncharacterized protein